MTHPDAAPTVRTERLVLRPFVAADVDLLYGFMAEPDVLRYFPDPRPPSREQVLRSVERQQKHWRERRCGWWAVELAATGQFAGWCGLQYLPETDETEVAYLLGHLYWGRGFATEGARAAVRFGFENLDVSSIVGIVHPQNVASRHVLEKCGLSLTEEKMYFGMHCCRYVIWRGTSASNMAQRIGGLWI